MRVIFVYNLINKELISEGYAFAYRHPKTDPEIRKWAIAAEEEAIRNKKGFWSLPEDKQPENPADFRKKAKTK